MNRRSLWLCVALWLAVIGWAATIVYFSSLPGPEIEEMMPFALWDKFLHFIAFVAGGVLLASALRQSTAWPRGRIALVGIAALTAFGATDEWHQLHTANRTGADVYDWLADALGAAAGAGMRMLAGRGRG
jgi:hypothetical protein